MSYLPERAEFETNPPTLKDDHFELGYDTAITNCLNVPNAYILCPQEQNVGRWKTNRRASKPGNQANVRMIKWVFVMASVFGYFLGDAKSDRPPVQDNLLN